MTGLSWSNERRRYTTQGYDRTYAETTPTWFTKTDKTIKVLMAAIRDSEYATGLSIGSGNGINEEKLAELLGIAIVCVDFHAVPLLDLARRADSKGIFDVLQPVQADLTHLPIVGSFDVVLSMKVLQDFSFEEQAGVLAALKGHVNDGGTILISTARIMDSKQEIAAQEEALVKNFEGWHILGHGKNAGVKKGRVVWVMAKRE